jgi:DNA-binding transcriptional LysR family regulator
MRIENLEHLLNVAKTGSISRSAQELFISQQGLSQAIQQMETELGVPLIYRSGNRISFTEAGSTFLKYAFEILLSYNQMQRELEQYKRKTDTDDTERLMIYVTPIVSNTLLSKILFVFHKRFPIVNLNVIEKQPVEMLNDVYIAESSIGIFSAPEYLVSESKSISTGMLIYKELHKSPLTVAVTANSHLASKSIITMDELSTKSFTLYSLERDLLAHLFKGRRQPTIALNSQNMTLCREMIIRGNVIGLTNEIIEKYCKDVRIRQIPMEETVNIHTGYLINPKIPENANISELIHILKTETEGLRIMKDKVS